MTATSPAAIERFAHSRGPFARSSFPGRRCSRRLHRLAAALAAAIAMRAHATAAQGVGGSPVMILGGDADDRLRIGQLLGQPTTGVVLIRSTSRLVPVADSSLQQNLRLGLPEVRAVRNSGLPFSMNDGPLWAGRGWNESVTASAFWRENGVTIIFAPTFVSSSNEAFQVIPYRQDGQAIPPRNVWANPFHPLPESIDLPLRFGDRSRQSFSLGQSSVTYNAGGAALGVATENLWWGPGIQNAITLSNNAAGFPHLFVQTRQPLHTRAGTFDAQWIVGELTESNFFDSNPSNDHRSLAGVAATWTTPFDSALTLGFARLVMGAQQDGSFPLGAAFDVLRSAGHLNVDTSAAVPPDARDQITSFFARWLLPGFEAYVEWARFEEPTSLQDFLEYPAHSEGYTLGFQWAHDMSAGRAFRLQSEASYMEPDPSLRLRPTAVTYTSRAVPQGFTQEGQMLGAAIGPGASSQWLAGDVVAQKWRLGSYLGRIRWDNGTFEEPIVPFFKRQDVSLFAGLRAGASWHDVNLLVDFTHAARFNYLFQTYTVPNSAQTKGIDLINNTLSVTLSTTRIR